MRDSWTKPPTQLRTQRIYRQSPPQLSAHWLAERSAMCVHGNIGTHLFRMSHLATCSVLLRDTLWIRPELPYRSRAGELTRGMLFSDQC